MLASPCSASQRPECGVCSGPLLGEGWLCVLRQAACPARARGGPRRLFSRGRVQGGLCRAGAPRPSDLCLGRRCCSQAAGVVVQVPEKKLKLVMADKELYRACAVEVKRQIWQDNQALFGDEVSPLLKQYILEKESALFSTELSVLHNFFSPSPKTRRQGEVRRGQGRG